MKFFFRAKDKSGEVREGVIEASTADVAMEVVQKNGLYPIVIREERANASFIKKFLGYWDRVSNKELMMFFRQLSILIEAKVPITASLLAIKEQTSNLYFQKIIEESINDIQDGLALSDALKKHRDTFSVMAINIIKAGEVSGNLKKSVAYVADNIEKSYTLTTKVKSAMTYPLVVIIVFFIIGFIVISFIVPKLTMMIKSMDVVVPWYTKGLIFVSDFMSSYWWAVLVVFFGFIGGLIYYLRTDDGKNEWDQIKIKLPIFGEIFQHVYIARFADNLGVLLVGGIPIIKALNVVSSVIGNSVYEKIFLKAADEVKIGGNMSDALRRFPEIPPIVSQMVKIGEESGQIDLVLGHISRFYEQETDEATKNLSTLIEPILMVVIGVAVGFLAFSIIMPIYDIAGQM
jgi:type IV pilus assembly protein PilC